MLSRIFNCGVCTAFAVLCLVSCTPHASISRIETREYSLSDSANNEADSSMEREITPYRDQLNTSMNVVLAESEAALEKGSPEGKLGNFVADACLEVSNQVYYPNDNKLADFAFFNNGGLRKSIPAGKITLGDVFELMPFENELVILSLPGNVVKKIINFIASKDGAPVSGIRFQIQDKQGVNIFINDLPFDSTKTYKVLTSDYLANGGDQYFFLTGAGTREFLNLKVRDALIQYLEMKSKLHQMISPALDGRIQHAR